MRVLVTITRPIVWRRIQALLAPADVELERAPNGPALEALASRRSFDLIIAELPLIGRSLSDCLKCLRSAGSASADSPVVLLGLPIHRSTFEKLDSDLQELVTMCTTVHQALRVTIETLELSDRSTVRLFAETEMIVDSVRLKRVCQTENISPSGMLLRSSRRLPVGAVLPFSLRLPDESTPILGRGEVVRHTNASENVSGMGVRFLGLDGNGNARLRSFLETR